MRPRLILVSGTGTEIGKTHLAVALVRRLAQRHKAAGFKPVESGVSGGEGEDARALRLASPFHVKPDAVAVRLRAPISPHLAARIEGVALDRDALVANIRRAATDLDYLLVELPGGLFSPLATDLLNVDLVPALDPDVILLVAPDRLGVLHDTATTILAARTRGVPIDTVLLNAPPAADASTGTNAAELRTLHPGLRVVGPFGRAPSDALATHPEVADLVDRLTRG